MSVFGNAIKKFADRYDPSVGAGVTMLCAMIILGGASVVALCAAAGAGVAALLGASAVAGALWGSGIVAGGTAALVSCLALPQAVKGWCYKHELKRRAAAGEDISGSWDIGGIEKILEQSRLARKTANKAFGAVAPCAGSSSAKAPAKARGNNPPAAGP